MLDMKILELATTLTEKAMGTDSTSVTWISNDEQVSQFLTTMAKTLDNLYQQTAGFTSLK